MFQDHFLVSCVRCHLELNMRMVQCARTRRVQTGRRLGSQPARWRAGQGGAKATSRIAALNRTGLWLLLFCIRETGGGGASPVSQGFR